MVKYWNPANDTAQSFLTHYRPTALKAAANDPRHVQDHTQVQSAFVTDILRTTLQMYRLEMVL